MRSLVLTYAELMTLEYIAKGWTNAKIAKACGLTPREVTRLAGLVKLRMQVGTQAGAVGKAYRTGILGSGREPAALQAIRWMTPSERFLLAEWMRQGKKPGSQTSLMNAKRREVFREETK